PAASVDGGRDLPITVDDVRRAQARVRGVVVHTPLLRLRGPGIPATASLWLKAETLQLTGSFKIRGAYNKLAALSAEDRARGVIAYSSGNHAQGVACAAQLLGIRATIVMPEDAPPVKLAATRDWGAEVVLCAPGSEARRQLAEALQQEHGYVLVPPYDDPLIMAGQGTATLEVLEDLPDVDLLVLPCGGGGLLSGNATALKALRPQAQIVGVEPELAADATASFQAGRVVQWPGAETGRTVADGLRTQAIGARPWQVIGRHVDAMVTVGELAILDAVRYLARHAHLVAEPSGAVTLAAVLSGQLDVTNRRSVLFITGGNVEPAALAAILAG
ncbi:MAG TPA: threonine/serine dehydratase, partial [Chloroflexia bacterium]|nr:threonine/serine dehydratase [Chloroflexia bacterium]